MLGGFPTSIWMRHLVSVEFGEGLTVGAARKAEWNKANRAAKNASQARHPRIKNAKPFAGFDGEGWADDSGSHQLYLLRAGESELYTGKPLDSWEIFDWLCSLPRNVYYVGFGLGYDWSMMLRALPQERFLRLHDRTGRTVGDRGVCLPVDWGPFRLDWIAGKRFSVWRSDTNKRTRFNVEDVLGCFQSTFARAIEVWRVASEAELDFISEMKQFRSEFGRLAAEPGGLDKIRRYNELECVLLARMMERVRDACDAQKINPSSWYGAGQLAQSILRKHRARDTMELDHSTVERLAGEAYYGGFFDVSTVGYFPTLYEYDIGSAYPHVMRSLPCLTHAHIRAGVGRGRTLYRVRWEPRKGCVPTWGAFPVRHSRGERAFAGDEKTFMDMVGAQSFTPGTLYYPLHGEGWYWDSEVGAVLNRGEFSLQYLDSWTLEKTCDCQPFEWIPELFEYRKKLGKSGQGMVLKLGMNSLYGKLAQHVGRPQFASAVWAGMVTSGTRGMIHDAIRRAGSENIVMVATDAVYSRKPIEGLKLGSGLGEWEAQEFERYVVVIPGLHYAADASKLKTRSVPVTLIREALGRIESHWYSDQRWDPIVFRLEAFISCQLAYQLKRPDLRGEWVDLPRSIRFGSPDKRRIPLEVVSGDSVELPLWENVDRLPSGHRSEWDYAEASRMAQEREAGVPSFASIADSQPDYLDPVAFWEWSR